MSEFEDFDLEHQDRKNRNTEHFEGSVTTAGVPVTVSTVSSTAIQMTYITNPNKGPNANSPGDLLYISWDGGTKFITLSRGSWLVWPGKGSGATNHQIKIDSNNDGTSYEGMFIV